MKKVKAIFGILLALALLNSCDHDTIRASGQVTSLDYSIPAYSELKVSDAFHAYVTFSDTEESVRVEANDNLHDRIVVQKEGKALVVRLKNFTNVRGNATMNVYITTKNIATFDLSGASRVTLDNEWTVSDGRIDLSGASNFLGGVTAERLYLDTTGASSLDLFGSVSSLNAKLKGSSDIKDFDLQVAHLNIALSGSSEAFLSVAETIDIEASGSSTLHYKGEATVNSQKLSGSSEINHSN